MKGASRKNGSSLSGNAMRVRRPLKIARTILCTALRHALEATGMPQAMAARSMGVRQFTVRRWLRGQSPIKVERVLRSIELGKHFIRCLASLERRARRAE